jgi:putative NADPH-quinone reductase
MARSALAGLRRAGHDAVHLDLCAEGFQPVMSAAEHRVYETDSPILDPAVQRHADLVAGADALVFVYPTWWAGLPAVLKGWLDRVLVTGVAFRLDERTRRVVPAMTHVRRLVGITTYGSPRWYVHAVGDAGRRTLARSLRMVCRRRARPVWLALYRMDSATEAARAAFLARVEARMAAL